MVFVSFKAAKVNKKSHIHKHTGLFFSFFSPTTTTTTTTTTISG